MPGQGLKLYNLMIGQQLADGFTAKESEFLFALGVNAKGELIFNHPQNVSADKLAEVLRHCADKITKQEKENIIKVVK